VKSLKNKTILITGASSGIGQATAMQYAQHGARILLMARRMERIQKMVDTVQAECGVEALAVELDVRNRQSVETTICDLPESWQNIDILVNNAGLALSTDKLQAGNPDNWDTMIDTNVKGLLYVTRAVLPGMLERERGHIVNLSSIAGYECYPGGNVYGATKHAVKAISQSLRLDLMGSKIRITDLAPGMVNTEFSEVRLNSKSQADKVYEGMEPLQAEDIADAIIYCTTRPAHVDVSAMVIMPTCQASANHVYRQS